MDSRLSGAAGNADRFPDARMNLIILGSQSDIAKAMMPMMMVDGWQVFGWKRGQDTFHLPTWDVILVAMGQVAPVGSWPELELSECMKSNLLRPIELLQELWIKRRKNASVCFMAGSNPNKVMTNYVPYAASKMALLKAVEHMDAESPDVKMFALAPGYVPTKIHRATLDAGIPNERIARGGGTPIAKIYDCFKWCLQQSKEVIGGRNICVSDPWDADLAGRLLRNPDLFKLRRCE